MRCNTNATLGWTPGDTTRIELSGAFSDGEAAYADRAMDGSKFERQNVGFKFEKRDLGRVVSRLELQAYYNYVDHVMDNFSLRSFTPSAMMPGRAVSNPDRRTTGGRLALDLQGPGEIRATLGIDRQDNRHRVRSTMNETMMPYENMARVEDGRFQNTGLFAESTIPAGPNQRVIAGLRADRWEARDSRARIALGMMGSMPNPTANLKRRTTLESGFARFERDLATKPVTLYAGVGHVQRFPDYWELLGGSKESADSLSAFTSTRPEKTTQLDLGLVYRSERLALSLSGFASDVDDYILIQSNFRKGMRTATIARNVDAKTLGAEADAVFALTPAWKVTGTLAYTRGTNDTDGGPLAQMPPLELRAGLDWQQGNWSAGLLTRVVAAQKRFALNQGNIVGQDLGRTGSFAVVSLNGAWRPTPNVLVSAGVDNLLDRVYAEHLSRGGAMISGFVQTTRVNEPGRTLWLKLSTDWR
jgi:iron complex outermembrane receptor protein